MSTRRSTRLVNKANSRASSVASADENNTTVDCKKADSKKKEDFDPDQAADVIIRTGNVLGTITKLTKPSLIQVIEAMNGRYRSQHGELKTKNQDLEDLQAELEKVKQERDAARATRRTLRHDQIDQKVAKILAEQKTQEQAAEASKQQQALATIPDNTTTDTQDADAAITEQAPAAHAQSANNADQMDVDLAGEHYTAPSIQDPANTPPSAETPPSADSHSAPLETPASRSFIHRLLKPLGGFFSPTPAKSRPATSASLHAEQAQTQQQPQQQPPLGELPAVRKRPAPNQEVTEPAQPTTPAFTTSTPKATPKSTRNAPPRANKPFDNPYIADRLEPITEQMEQSQGTLLHPRTPARRSIMQVRSQKAQRQSALNKTPAREWDRTPAPRIPNADARFEKLHATTTVEKKMRDTQEDDEMQEFHARGRKRVKVDFLRWIPHRAPGDSESTFRVPDIDADGYMEVDEDIPLLPNVFEESQAEERQKEMEQLAESKGKQAMGEIAPVTPGAMEATHEVETMNDIETAPAIVQNVTDVWAFPTVGKRPESEMTREIDPYLVKKFAYGFESWKRGHHLVEW